MTMNVKFKRDEHYFFFHFFLFGSFDVGDFFHGVDFHLGAHDFNLILVHGSVGTHDLGIFHASGAAHGDLLLQNKPVAQERVSDASSGFLDYMNVVQVRISVQTQHSIHRQLGEVFFVLSQQFRG